MPMTFLSKVKTKMGSMNVSGPELTALDCVANERKIGGMSRVAEVTAELSESMSWTEDKLVLLDYFSAAVVQRLGYLLDILEETALADSLYALLKQSGKQMRKVPLKQSAVVPEKSEPVGRWKIIENCNIDIDEL